MSPNEIKNTNAEKVVKKLENFMKIHGHSFHHFSRPKSDRMTNLVLISSKIIQLR